MRTLETHDRELQEMRERHYHGRGRPKGSRNKPKIAPEPRPIQISEIDFLLSLGIAYATVQWKIECTAAERNEVLIVTRNLASSILKDVVIRQASALMTIPEPQQMQSNRPLGDEEGERDEDSKIDQGRLRRSR